MGAKNEIAARIDGSDFVLVRYRDDLRRCSGLEFLGLIKRINVNRRATRLVLPSLILFGEDRVVVQECHLIAVFSDYRGLARFLKILTGANDLHAVCS